MREICLWLFYLRFIHWFVHLIRCFNLATEVIDHAAPTLDSNYSGLLHFCWTTIVELYSTHFHILVNFDLQYITLAPCVLSCMRYGLWCLLIFRLQVLSEVRNFTSIANINTFVHCDTLNRLETFDPIFLGYDFIILH